MIKKIFCLLFLSTPIFAISPLSRPQFYNPKLFNGFEVDFSSTNYALRASTANFVALTTSYINTGNETTGNIYWDNNNHTASMVLENGVILQIGQEGHAYGKNTSTFTISNGDAVSITSAGGSFTTFGHTIATSAASAYAYIGLATQDIAVNDFGYVTLYGVVRGIDTSAWTEGRPVYVDPLRAGKLTTTYPSVPNYVINAGIVEYSHLNQGRINVTKGVAPKLAELSDVNGTPLTTSGQIPVWNNEGRYFDFTTTTQAIASSLLNSTNTWTAPNTFASSVTISSLLNPTTTTASNILEFLRNDTSIVAGDEYGSIEFQGKDTTTSSNGVRGRIVGYGTDSAGSMDIVFETKGQTSSPLLEILRLSAGTSSILGKARFFSGTNNELLVSQGSDPALSRVFFTVVPISTTAACSLDFAPTVLSTYTAAYCSFFRNTNTSGVVGNYIYKGDGTASVNALLSGNSNSYTNVLIGNFGIGTNSPTSKLYVSGTEDIIQSIIKGYSSQTSNLTQWQNSAGTALASISASGKWGLGIAPNEQYRMYSYYASTVTTAQDEAAFSPYIRASHTSSSAARYYGVLGTMYSNAGYDITGSLNGFRGSVTWASTSTLALSRGMWFGLANTGGGTITAQASIFADITNSSGTITDAKGIISYLNNATPSKIGTYTGLYLQNYNNSSASNYYGIYAEAVSTGTNAYGLYLNNITATTNSYALYTNSGLNRLGDQLSIVGSTDVVQNIIKGYSAQTKHLTEWRNSADTVLASVDQSGQLGIGTDPTTLLDLRQISASATHISKALFYSQRLTGTTYGVGTQIIVEPASNSTAEYRAATFDISSSKNVNIGYMFGARYGVGYNSTGTITEAYGQTNQIQLSGTGTIGNAIGVSNYISNEIKGTISTAIGNKSQIVNNGSGTITTAYCFYGKSATNSGGGTITFNAGMYLEDQIVGNSNYGIYTNKGINRLGDQLSVEGGADRVQQIVKGYSTQTTNLSEWQSSVGTVLACFNGSGQLGIGTNAPSAMTDILATTEQLRLGYSSTKYASFTVGSTGGLTLANTTDGSTSFSHIYLKPKSGSVLFNATSLDNAYYVYSYATNAAGKTYQYSGGTFISFINNDITKTYITSSGNSYFNTGNLGIGIISPTAKLHIVGSSDTQQLIVKGNSTQTNDLTQWQNSAGTVLSEITSTGSFVTGTATDYVEVSTNGITLYGGSTAWDDLRVEPIAKNTGAKAPSFNSWKTTLALYDFDDAVAGSEKEVFFQVQMPHDWLEGSAVSPHVHWVNRTGTVTGQTVRWGLEYTTATIGGTFPASVTIYSTTTVMGVITSTDSHHLTDFSDIDMTGNKISTVITCRLFRNSSDATDTYTGTAGLLYIDFHYQRNSLGSKEELSK